MKVNDSNKVTLVRLYRPICRTMSFFYCPNETKVKTYNIGPEYN